MLKLGIAGNPVFHTRSTELFQLLSEKYSIELKYIPISTPNSQSIINFSKVIDLKGLNITTPLKKSIMELLTKIDYQASNLNSVNTILLTNDSFVGYNTDYFGILQTIWDQKLIFNKKKVVILGSGSAALTAAFAIKNLNAKIYIWDRDEEKARKAADDLSVSYLNDNKLIQQLDKFDYIISTIPPNSKILTELKFSKHQTIIDTIYHSSFFHSNQNNFNYIFISGYNWLINQVLLSFEMFTGIHPQKDGYKEEFLSKPDKKYKNFIFINSSESMGNKLLQQIASELDFYFININEEISKAVTNNENLVNEIESKILQKTNKQIQNSDDKFIISVDNRIISDSNNLELLKGLGSIIWIYDPSYIDKDQNDFNFANSDFVFILSPDIEESKERLISEIERII